MPTWHTPEAHWEGVVQGWPVDREEEARAGREEELGSSSVNEGGEELPATAEEAFDADGTEAMEDPADGAKPPDACEDERLLDDVVTEENEEAAACDEELLDVPLEEGGITGPPLLLLLLLEEHGEKELEERRDEVAERELELWLVLTEEVLDPQGGMGGGQGAMDDEDDLALELELQGEELLELLEEDPSDDADEGLTRGQG
jgi:hypothetical protein